MKSVMVVLAALVLVPAVGSGADPALAEVNAARAAKGLPPFVEDPGLTAAAVAAADFRCANGVCGHVGGGGGDFRFLPPGTRADAAGCAAWANGTGWGSCCTYDNYQYAGAAAAVGPDGKRFMHLFVRGQSTVAAAGGCAACQTADAGRTTRSVRCRSTVRAGFGRRR